MDKEMLSQALNVLGMPCVMADPSFSVIWSNACVKNKYSYLGAVDAVRSLLSGYDLKELLERMETTDYSLTVPSLLPMVSTVMEFSPVYDPVSHQLEVMIVHFTIAPDAVPGNASFSEPMLYSFNRGIRNPVTSLFSSLSCLTRKLEEEECYGCEEYLTSMTQNCYSMLRTCISVTEFSRYENGMVHLRKSPLDMVQYLRRLLDAAAILVQDIGVHLTYNLPDRPVILSADPEKLSVALFSLLSNCCTYHEGKVSVQVTMTVSRNKVHIKITDDGYGMAEETFAHAMEPYFSRGLDESSVPGLGLGLPLARQIIESHGGSFAVQSVQDQGTSVAFTLPLESDDSQGEEEFSTSSSEYLLNRFSPLHVFLSNVLPPKLL